MMEIEARGQMGNSAMNLRTASGFMILMLGCLGPSLAAALDPPPPGRYACYTRHFSIFTGQFSFKPFGQIYLRLGGLYSINDDTTIGNYRFDGSTGNISWISGSFEKILFRESRYVGLNNSGHTIKLVHDETVLVCHGAG